MDGWRRQPGDVICGNNAGQSVWTSAESTMCANLLLAAISICTVRTRQLFY